MSLHRHKWFWPIVMLVVVVILLVLGYFGMAPDVPIENGE